mgnify:CR=1 FL=1
MLKKIIIQIFTLNFVLTTYAQSGESGGMPQLNPEFWISQIVWLVLTFGILYVVLSKLILPKISDNLESRKSQILENIDEKNKNSILSALPPKDRFALLEGLSYPEDSAARIMQREFTAIPSNWSVGQTIDYLRENKDLSLIHISEPTRPY